MGDLTKNFDKSEFKCHCCDLNLVKYKLVTVLQAIRDHFGEPIIVLSGTRCPKHNKEVGGAKNSQHMLGNAADIHMKRVSPKDIATFAKTLMPGWGGIKAYPTFTHIDIRAGKWRG